MKFTEIKTILSTGESTRVEFKRKVTTAQKIAKEISAMANTKGGHLFVGIDDDGTIYGIHSEKSEIELINLACQFHIFPPIDVEIEIFSIKTKDIIVVKIPESDNKPHKVELIDENGKTSKKAMIRVGEQSIMASSEMARLLSYQNSDEKLVLSIGEKEKALFNYLEKYGRASVLDFANLVNISRRRAERLMIRLARAGAIQIHNDSHNDYFSLVDQ